MTFEKGFTSMLFARARRREERGAILVLAATGMVVAMIAAGLAIDLGRIAQAARDDQRIADLAALDASRVVPADYAVAAAASAARNGVAADTTVTAIEGVKTNGQCVPAAGSGTVCVTVTSPHKNAFPFLGGRDSVTRTAMAGRGAAIGAVRVGSNVAQANGTIPATQVLILDKMISGLIGSNYSTTAVGWQGLASGSVTFGALTSALAGVTGNGTFNTGTTDEVLNSSFTMAQLLTATANVLNNNGNSSVATDVTGIKNGINTTATYLSVPLKLYDFFNFGSVVVGNKQDVANMSLNVLELIKSGAILADGDHFATFNLTANDIFGATGGLIPGGFNSVKVNLGLIEAPQSAYGPPGTDGSGNFYTAAHTSQIRVRLDVNLRIPLTQAIKVAGITVPGLGVGALIDTNISYYLDGGTGHGYLAAIRCGGSSVPTGVDILGKTDVTRSQIGFVTDANMKNTLTVPVPTIDPAVTPPVLSIAGLLNVRLNAVVNPGNIPGNSGETKTFAPPYAADSPSQAIAGTMLAMPSLAEARLTLDPLVALLDTGTLLSTLVTGINSTGLTFSTNSVGLNTSILKPVYDALGLSFGGADLWAPPVQTCAALSSLGPITNTNPPVLTG